MLRAAETLFGEELLQTGRVKLDFIALVREQDYFAVRSDALDVPAMRELLALMRQPAYARLVASLPGYDASHTGELVAMADAFSLGPDTPMPAA